jgi:hypothetical protein
MMDKFKEKNTLKHHYVFKYDTLLLFFRSPKCHLIQNQLIPLHIFTHNSVSSF